MAITDAEKQEIIDELLAEIRNNGLDYSGQTITFPNAFNVTQTERQNIKIPAIDERSATPVHGNVDLEALLTAYGVTHVEEIASDISSIYMKKTADSNLNMNGYNVSGVKMSNSYTPLGYTAPYAELPQLSYATLGLADLSSFEEFMRAWTLKVIDIYGTPISVRGKVLVDSRTGYGDIWGWVATGTDSNGATSFCCIYQDYYPGRTVFMYRKNASDSIHVEQYPTFPFGDTTKDNRINAMGAGYIRYENGLQICWGQYNVAVTGALAWGSWYYKDFAEGEIITYAQRFSSLPAVSVVAYNSFTIGRVVPSSSSITKIEFYCPDASTTTNVTGYYIAIGKWR